jgi:hypothetical protein
MNGYENTTARMTLTPRTPVEIQREHRSERAQLPQGDQRQGEGQQRASRRERQLQHRHRARQGQDLYSVQSTPRPSKFASLPGKPSSISTPALIMTMLDTGQGTSDLIFSPGRPPQVEANGQLTPVIIANLSILDAEDTARIARDLRGGSQQALRTLKEQGEAEGAAAEAAGLNVAWSLYRGTGRVTFAALAFCASGRTRTGPRPRAWRSGIAASGIHNVACGAKPAPSCGALLATFNEPCVFTLRAAARQDGLQSLAFVRVTVNP